MKKIKVVVFALSIIFVSCTQEKKQDKRITLDYNFMNVNYLHLALPVFIQS